MSECLWRCGSGAVHSESDVKVNDVGIVRAGGQAGRQGGAAHCRLSWCGSCCRGAGQAGPRPSEALFRVRSHVRAHVFMYACVWLCLHSSWRTWAKHRCLGGQPANPSLLFGCCVCSDPWGERSSRLLRNFDSAWQWLFPFLCHCPGSLSRRGREGGFAAPLQWPPPSPSLRFLLIAFENPLRLWV